MSVSSGSYNHNHLLPARPGLNDVDEIDACSIPMPFLSRRCSPIACPPPIGPLPEPSFHTQVLLGEMFSQRATMRNYCADSIQAFMMALDGERRDEQERIQEEKASLALARALEQQDYQQQQQQQQQEQDYTITFAEKRQSFVSSDLSFDLGSISEGSNSTSSQEEDRERMPMPPPPMPPYHPSSSSSSISYEKDLKMAAQYDYRPSFARQSIIEKDFDPLAAFASMAKGMNINKMNVVSTKNSAQDVLSKRWSDEESDEKTPLHHQLESLKIAPPARAATAARVLKQPPIARRETHAGYNNSNNHSNCNNSPEDGKKKKRRDRQCLICHRSTAECRLRMRKLSCGHQFCRSCIDRWLDTKDSCPYCRQKVSEQTRQKIRRQNSVGAASA